MRYTGKIYSFGNLEDLLLYNSTDFAKREFRV